MAMHTFTPLLLTLLSLTPHTLAVPAATPNLTPRAAPQPLLPDSAKSPPSHCHPEHCFPMTANYNYATGLVTIFHDSSFYELPLSLTSPRTILPLHPLAPNNPSISASVNLPASISYPHNTNAILSLPDTARTLYEMGRIPSPAVYITQRFIAFGGFEPIMVEGLPVRVFNAAAPGEPLFVRMNTTLVGEHRGWELMVAAELDLGVLEVEVPRSYGAGKWGMLDMGIEMEGPFVEVDKGWRMGRRVLETTVLLAVYNANGTLLHQNRRLSLPSTARGVIVPYYDPGHPLIAADFPRWWEKRASFALLKSGRPTMSAGWRMATVIVLIAVIVGVFAGGSWGYVHFNQKRWDRESPRQRLLFGWYMPRWAVRSSWWREI